MSPEEWLAQQPKTVEQPKAISPEEWLATQKKAAEGPIQVEQDAPDFVRGLTNYLPQTEATYGGAKVLAGKALNNKEIIQSGLEHMQAGEAKTQVKESDEFLKAWDKGIGTVLTDWLPYQVGSGVGSIAETLAMSGLGALVGGVSGAGVGAVPGAAAGFVSKQLVKKGIKDAAEAILRKEGKEAAEAFVENEAKKTLTEQIAAGTAKQGAKSYGATAGIIGQAGLHGAGETTQQAVETAQEKAKAEGREFDPTKDLDLGRLLPAAVVHSIADFATEKIGLGALKGVGESTGKSFVMDLVKAIGITGTKELVPEEIQTMAERYGANLSLTDAEAIKNYINTAAASYAMSIAPGGIGGVRTHLNARVPEAVPNTTKDEVKTGTETTNTTDVAPPVDKETETLLAPTINSSTGETIENAAPAKESIYEVPKKEAGDYLASIESETVKPNASVLKKHIKALDLEVPSGPGFNQRAIEAIKGRLAEGEQNVIQSTDTGTSGVSTQVSGGPPANGAAVGTQGAGLGRTGVDSNQSLESTSQNGTTVQQSALNRPSTITPEEMQAGLEKDQAEAAQAEVDRKAGLEEVAGKKIPQTKTETEIRDEYELSRQALTDSGVTVPEWGNLKTDEKDKYLGVLPTNPSAEDFDNAAKTLAAYMEQKKGTPLTPVQQRIANGYEDNRRTYERGLNITLPAWGELPQAAKDAYLNNVKNNTALEQNEGFNAVADVLEQEGTAIRGVSRAGMEELQLKSAEQEAKSRAQTETKQRQTTEAEAVGKGIPVSDEVRTALEEGDINSALESLITTAKGLKLGPQKGETGAIKELAKRQSILSKVVNRALAYTLSGIKFNSTVITDLKNEVIQRLEREGKLAEYDPKTDTFYFTKNGFDEATVLHEILHAATVKLINQYLTNPDSLLPYQRKALDHLSKIYDFAKKRMGGKYKNAFENLYEFVSYALTDTKFQTELANTQVRSLAEYTKNVAKSLWDQLTNALSNLFGLTKATGTKLEVRPELFDAFAKGLAPMDKEGLYELTEEGVTTTDVGEMVPGQKAPVKETKQKYKPGKMFLSKEAGYEGNLLLEVSEILNDIIEPPEKGINVEPLAAKKVGAAEEGAKLRESEEIIAPEKDTEYGLATEHKPKNLSYFHKLLFTKEGWRRIATKVQNERYEIKHWEDVLELAGKIFYEGKDKINNIYGQLTLSTSRAKNLFNSRVEGTYEKLDQAVYNFAKAAGLNTERALASLHRILEAVHEPERRAVKYLMTVPLSTVKNLSQGGQMISAAERRDQIFKLLDTKKLTEAQAQQLRAELNAIVFMKGTTKPNTKYVDPLGSSPRSVTEAGGKKTPLPTDIDNELYNVTGLSPKAVAARLDKYNNSQYKSQIDEVLKYVQELNTTTTDLNKMANYWSQPVSNRVAFYGFENYVPLKGVVKHSDADEFLDFDGAKMGKELQDVERSFEGRISVSDNPVLQVMSDATRAAMRAGRKDLTQAIKNSLAKSKLNPEGQGILKGRVLQHVTFEQRRDENFINSLPRENTVFHYNEDGSIDVLEINDKRQREAIRRTYRDTNPLVDVANKVTSGLGMLHTRYNYNFAPLNFVRDALTNAWTIGAEMGPAQAAKFIAQIGTKVVVKGSLAKAMRVAALYESKDIDQIKALAAKDPVVKDMYDFITEGGMVDYLQGISLKSNFQQLQREIGRSGVMRNVTQFNKFIDIWTDMFELTSRSAAYAIAKQNFKEQGLTDSAAKTKAAAYAKNLANFEQVGQHGKALGAVFMFFRPSATGAVRAIEAALPAFGSVNDAVKRLPPEVSKDPAAVEAFRKNYAAKQKSARYMLTTLMGAGALAYTMAAMMSDDDDLGRNKLMTDDMSQWTRFARFYTPFSNNPIQLPWGFGLGAFAAGGAQLAAVGSGQQSIGGALGNIATQISLDSFVPIPISRMPIQDNPAMWMLDSITPSMLRPALEFVVNKNGLGQSIYNDSNRRMGDAYLGGDNIPEIYKDLSRWLVNTTNGDIDWSPNSIYFLVNSYADGPGRIVDGITNGMYLAAGKAEEKDFLARAKGTPLVGSFIGAEPNVDSREFSSVEKQVKDMASKVNMFRGSPEQYLSFVTAYPMAEAVVDIYDKSMGDLNKLRAEGKAIRLMNLDPRERADLLKMNKMQQNIIKHNLVETFKNFDVKP